MSQQPATGLDIKNKLNITAPTPQNTPSTPAPITSNFRPTNQTIHEDLEPTGTGNNPLSGAFTGNPALLSMLQGKLGTLVGRSSGYVESLPPSVKRRIDGLKHFQSKNEELENQFQNEVLALEKKYLELYRPLYNQRADIVTGKCEPTDEQVEAGKKVDAEDDEDEEEEQENEKDEQDDIIGIPEFWLTALKNHPGMAELIEDDDEEPLKKLIDIHLSYLEADCPGFQLEFVFGENDYFTNKSLTKTYYYQKHASGGDFIYDRAEGCPIQWKEGKDLTTTVEKKKQRNKRTNQTRVVKRTVEADTFFNFFNPPTPPENNDDLDVEEAEALDAKLEADYEAGEEFKDKIIPHAVDYFTGKASEYEDFGQDEDEDDFEDEDLIDDSDNEDDDEDDDDDSETGGNNGGHGKEANAPDCKQS